MVWGQGGGLHSYNPFLSCGCYIVKRFKQATPTHSLGYCSFDHIISTLIAVHQWNSPAKPLITRRSMPYSTCIKNIFGSTFNCGHIKTLQQGSSLQSRELEVKSPPFCTCFVLTKCKTVNFNLIVVRNPVMVSRCCKKNAR